MPSQWETSLLCNAVSHWLGANVESALVLCCPVCFINICPATKKLSENPSLQDSLKTVSCHHGTLIVIKGTTGLQIDNLRCRYRRQSWDHSSVSVLVFQSYVHGDDWSKWLFKVLHFTLWHNHGQLFSNFMGLNYIVCTYMSSDMAQNVQIWGGKWQRHMPLYLTTCSQWTWWPLCTS